MGKEPAFRWAPPARFWKKCGPQTARPAYVCVYIYIHNTYMSNGLLSEQGKNRNAPVFLKRYKTRYTPAKRDRKLRLLWFLENPKNGQHPERDQIEIGRDTDWNNSRPTKDKTRLACQKTPGFSLLECHVSWNTSKTRYTPEKRDWHEFW